MENKYSIKAFLNIFVKALKWLKWFFSELIRYCRYKVKVFYKKYGSWRSLTFRNKILSVFLILLFTSGLVHGGIKYEKDRNQKSVKESTSTNEDVKVIVQNSALTPSKQELGNFSISIDKIGFIAPIIRGVDPTNKEEYDKALEDGVAHMTGTALPGDGTGKVFIYGHSSDSAKTRFGFSRLNDLQNGDEINVNYYDKDFIYIVNDKKIVEKTELSVIDQTPDETLALMSCWPLGTDDKRLLVFANKKQ